MYTLIKYIILIGCLSGIIYVSAVNKKYKNDKSSTKEDIIKYFEEQKAFDVESGIKIKDLPISISKNKYLLLMVKDKTLVFKKGKYFLNRNI